MKIQHILSLLLLSILLPLAGHGQTSVEFTYDDGGNRILRSIIELKSATVQSGEQTSGNVSEPTESQIGQQNVKIYPNPTDGIIRIEFSDFDESTQGKILLYDLKGRVVYEQERIAASNTLNFETLSNGAYILKLKVNNKKREWKIIKN